MPQKPHAPQGVFGPRNGTEKPFRRLTDAELQAFDHDGFLLVREAVKEDLVAAAREVTDRIAAEYGSDRLANGSAYERVNIIEDDPLLADLMEHPAILGSALSVLGGALQLLISTQTYRPTSPMPAIRWHTDDPSPYFYPRINGQCPVWQLKTCLYLSDVNKKDMGNFVAAPGSHKRGIPKLSREQQHILEKDGYKRTPDVAGAIRGAHVVTANAGDLLIFHPGLWHSVSPNTSGITRKNLWYVFGPLWMRLGDRDRSSEALLGNASQVRRQLLGATTVPERSALAPTDVGAPLVSIWEGLSYEQVYRRERNAILESFWSRTEGGRDDD